MSHSETTPSRRFEDTIPQLANVDVPKELHDWIVERMGMYPEKKSAIIPCMMAAQKLHGWLSPEAIDQVAAVMQLTPAELASVASFYDMFLMKPSGENTIYMCTNISCMLRGADAVMEELEKQVGVKNGGTSEDGIFLRNFECLGACDIAPMASVNGEFVGPLTLEDAKTLVDDLRAGREVLPSKQIAHRPVATTLWENGGKVGTYSVIGSARENQAGNSRPSSSARASDEGSSPQGEESSSVAAPGRNEEESA